MRNTSLRRVGGGRRGLSLNHLAGALHCRKIPDTPSCNARRWKERLRSICDAPYLCEEGKKPKKQREAEPDTRSSSDPIKKLLRYWRLNVSDVLIPPPPPSSRRVPIFFLCTVCVLCISLANRRRGFSSVSFHPSFSLSFSLSLCFFRILRNEDRISTGCVRASELMNERGRNGHRQDVFLVG